MGEHVQKTLICNNCKASLNLMQRSPICPQCSSHEAEFQFHLGQSEKLFFDKTLPGIWRFKDLLPDFMVTVSLGEGNTPLRQAANLYKKDLKLFLKIEGNNPTGSFLDRVSPLMVSDALDRKMTSLICSSDGNLGASLSAYCASTGLKCLYVVPKSTSPEKKVQINAYGAEIINYGETIDDSLELALKMVDQTKYQATPEFNLLTIEGSKTISFEIIEQMNSLNEWIDFIVVPLGSGRLLYSLWKGFQEAKKLTLFDKPLPKIIGVQVKGYDSIITAFRSGDEIPKAIKRDFRDQSLADAIVVRQSLYGIKALQSIIDSNGLSVSVSETEIVEASKILAQVEGIFAELSSATVIAAIEQLLKGNYFDKDARILALITSSGLKTSQAFDKSTTREKRVESFRSMGTKIEILTIINSSEANFGYEIWKSLGQTISLQAVYQHLKELQNAHHIEEMESTDRQKKYKLTQKGKMLIQKMKELEELLS